MVLKETEFNSSKEACLHRRRDEITTYDSERGKYVNIRLGSGKKYFIEDSVPKLNSSDSYNKVEDDTGQIIRKEGLETFCDSKVETTKDITEEPDEAVREEETPCLETN